MKKSYMTALSGIICAISIILLFATAILPFAEYILPAVAGALLMVLVIELGYKYAFSSFFAVSLIAFFIVPSKEVALLFIMFFGYYPIVKGLLEKLNSRFFEWCLKLIIFNLSICLVYFLLINLFGMSELYDDISGFKFGISGMLLIGNVIFILYDLTLTKTVTLYIYKLQPLLNRKNAKR